MDLVKNTEQYALSRGFGVREFGEILEKAMKREAKETKKTSFAPSGLSYQGSCPRRWYYAFNGATFEYDTPATAVANMNAGSDAGVRLAKVLDDAGLLIAAEEEARYEDPPIFGYIDARINWKGEEVLVEIKTTHDAAWNKRVAENKVPGYQLIQLLIYMYIKDISRGFFLTENKNTHELFVLPVRMTEEKRQLVERVFDWMRKVKDNADNGELPKRPFTKSSVQCKGCDLRNTCWDGWKRGKVNGSDPNPGTIEIETLELPK